MTQITIEYKDIGREKWNATKTYELKAIDAEEVAEYAFREARGHLMSSEVDAVYNSMKNEGTIIVGGWRPVGTFRVANWKSLVWRPAK